MLATLSLLALHVHTTASQDGDEWQQNYLSNVNKTRSLEMCEKNNQPLTSFPRCATFVAGYQNFSTNDRYPEAIACGHPYGDAWAPAYQPASCCDGLGRYFVATGQTGALDFGFASPNPSALCQGYARAMTAIVCSPYQGDFVRNNTLYVCKDSCDALLDACGPPGVNLPEWAVYDDAESLCKAAWGGFGTSCGRYVEFCPVDSLYVHCSSDVYRPGNGFCGIGMKLEVAEEDCLAMIRPNLDLSEAAEYDYAENKYCPTTDGNVDVSHPCRDVEDALEREQADNSSRRLLAEEDTCHIPMFARDEASRRIAIENGCFDTSSAQRLVVELFALLAAFLCCCVHT